MKLLFLVFVFVLFTNFLKAEINVNKCDNLTKRTDKINCLTKLKAKAIKENSKEKAKIIQNKLSKFHNRLGEGVEKTEEGIANTGKKIGQGATRAEKNIQDGAKKTYIYIKNIFKRDKTE